MTEPPASPNDFERDKAGTHARAHAEAAIEDLRRRGGLFVEAVRATRMAMALTDPTLPGNPIVFANQAFLDLTGYSMEEVLGQQPYFMNGPDTDPGDAERFRRILETDEDGVVETVQYAKDGRRFVATVLLSAFKDDSGKTLHHFLSWADVTRRVEAEDDVAGLRTTQAALREREEQQAFQLRLSDSLASLTDPAEIQAEATRLLGERLGVGWCYFNEFDARGTRAAVLRDFHRNDLPSMTGVHALSGEGDFLDLMHSGALLDMPDLARSPYFSARTKAAYGDLGIRSALGAPLLRNGRLVAVLLAADTRVRPWTGGDAELLKGAAERTWAALQRARTEHALRESEERQRFLLALGDAVRAERTANGKIEAAARLLGERLGASRVLWAEYDWEKNVALIFNGWFADGAQPFPTVMRLEDYEGEVLNDLRAGRTVRVDDVGARGDEPAYAAIAELGVQALLSLPLLVGGVLKVNLSIHQHASRRWTDDEVTLVREVAERLWAEVVRARAEAALRESEAKLEAELHRANVLRNLAARLVTEDSLAAIYDEILSAALAITEADAGTVQVYDPATRSLMLLVTRGFSSDMTGYFHRVDAGRNTACGTALRTGRREFVDFDPASDESCRKHIEAGYHSAQATPLLSRDGSPIGMLNTHWRARGHRPEADQLRFLDLLARQAADLIEQRRAEAALRESESRLSAAFQSVPVGIAVIDKAGRVILANSDYRRFMPSGIIPSRDGESVNRWRAWDEAGQPVGSNDFPGARALRGESVVPGMEMLYAEDDGSERWTQVATAPTLDAQGAVSGIVSVVSDIDVLKRSTEALRESRERQAFLLKLSDALRPLIDAVEIQTVALRLLAEHLDLSRAAYSEIQEDHDRAIRVATYDRDLPQLPRDVRISDFSADQLGCYLEGRPFVVTDTETDERVAATRDACRAIQVRAWVGVPLVKSGRLLTVLGVEKTTPYAWSDAEVQLLQEAAERTWAAAERGRIEAELRASEARLQSALEISTVGVLFWGPDVRLAEANDAFLRFTGFTREEAVGKTWQELTPPEFHAASEQAMQELQERGEATPYEKQYYRKDGSRWWGLFAPRRLSESEVVEFVIDINERKRADEALRESDERFRRFGEASQDILWIRDAATLQWTYLTPAFETIYGLSREEALKGDNYTSWLDLIVPEDRERAAREIEKVRSGEHVVFDYRIRRPSDGAIRWLRNTDFPILDGGGKVAWVGGIGHDVTELRETEHRSRLLLAELQHRVRNIMAMIRSVARRTGETTETVEDYVQHLEGRIGAMARTQALLTRNVGALVDLESLVLDELNMQAAQPRQFTVTGPDVLLPPKAAEVLGLAVHELATNSVKYGALSEKDGRVDVRWALLEGDGTPQLSLIWSELGVRIDRSPERSGFGTELITQRVPYELNGTGTMEFPPTGLVAAIEFPLAERASILQTDEGL